MTTPATTIGAKNPAVAKPPTAISGASRVSASRALVERRSAWKPRIADAVAAPAATMQSTRMTSESVETDIPSPSSPGSESTRWSSSWTSSVCSVEIRCQAVSTSTTDPPMISHPARVV